MALQEGLYRQFLEGKYTDLTITCGGREFKVHRLVLCAQSKVFARMCEGGFKEAEERVVDLPDDDPEILEHFLSYMYTGEYADGVYARDGKPSPVALLPQKKIECYLTEIGLFIREHPHKVPTIRMDSAENDTTHENLVNWHCPKIQYSVSRQVQSLYTSIRIYIMADKFDVGGLKLSACQRFWVVGKELLFVDEVHPVFDEEALKFQTHEHLLKAVSMVYDNTGPHDKAIRILVGCLLKAGLKDEHFWELMMPAMEEHRELYVLVTVLGYGPPDKKDS